MDKARHRPHGLPPIVGHSLPVCRAASRSAAIRAWRHRPAESPVTCIDVARRDHPGSEFADCDDGHCQPVGECVALERSTRFIRDEDRPVGESVAHDERRSSVVSGASSTVIEGVPPIWSFRSTTLRRKNSGSGAIGSAPVAVHLAVTTERMRGTGVTEPSQPALPDD